jgi:hypothetical protein
MPQLITISNPCPKCRAEFEAQRTEYCREFLRYQRENFAQHTEINALEVQLKHALEKLLKAERELIQTWKISQQALDALQGLLPFPDQPEPGVIVWRLGGSLVCYEAIIALRTLLKQHQTPPAAQLEAPKCSPA